MNKKIGRNDLCYCKSGRKYIDCHYGIDKKRIVKTNLTCDCCNTNIDVDFTNSYINKFQANDIPLMNFCKKNGFYMFRTMSLHHILELKKKFDNGTLTKKDFYDAYKDWLTLKKCHDFFKVCYKEIEQFEERQEIIFDAVEAHYSKKFTLSIHTFFLLIEGILRELYGISNKDTIHPKFDKEIWNKRLLFTIEDRIGFLNGYINSLFEGGKTSEVFNRNTVLHGINKEYYTEENSWSLLLLLYEIGHLKITEKNTEPFSFEKAVDGVKVIPPKI